MDSVGNEFLAGATLSRYEHGCISPCDTADNFEDILKCPRIADDFYFALRVVKRRLCIDRGSSLIELAQGVFHNGSELKGKSFFFQDILGALLGCLNDLRGGGESVCENN